MTRHLVHPQFLFDILTLGTMTISTTIPTVKLTLASRTGYFVSTQCRRFTIAYMLQYRAHAIARRVFFYKGAAELSDDSPDGKSGWFNDAFRQDSLNGL